MSLKNFRVVDKEIPLATVKDIVLAHLNAIGVINDREEVVDFDLAGLRSNMLTFKVSLRTEGTTLNDITRKEIKGEVGQS